MGKAGYEVGGRAVQIHSIEGGKLATGCKRPGEMVFLGRRVRGAAVVIWQQDREASPS